MLTQLTAVLPVETGLSIPSTPGEISPDLSLADLNAIKTSWAQSARELGFPEQAYNVASCLGREIVTHPSGRVHKVWSSENVYALAREYTERYIPAKGTNLMVRFLVIYIGEPDCRHKSFIDQIVLSDKMFKVAYWHWSVVGEEITEWNDNYFVPGNWFNVFQAASLAAEKVVFHFTTAKMEHERQRLLAELLAGHNF
jgi:hypothetical protein